MDDSRQDLALEDIMIKGIRLTVEDGVKKMGDGYPGRTVWTTMHARGFKCRKCGASRGYIVENEGKLKCSVCGREWRRERRLG